MTRARNAVVTVFAVNGLVLASWMSRLPDVKEDLDLSASGLGVLLLAMSAGALIGLPAAGRIAHRIGTARTVRLGAVLQWPGMVLVGVSVTTDAPLGFSMIGLLVFGVGNGIWDVAQNLAGSRVEQALGRAIMPWFHAAFSIGTVAGALVGAAMTWIDVPVGIHLATAVTVATAAAWWGSHRFLADPAPQPHAAPDAEATSGGSVWIEPRTWLIGIIVLTAAFTEGTANDWMAVAFTEGHHVSSAAGVLGLVAFMAAMTLGRILGTGLLDRYGRVLVLRCLQIAALVGCLMVVFGSTPVAYLGAAVWGLGASLGFPVGMSAAADDPVRAATRISMVATIGYTAFLAGPPLLGFLGDEIGVLRALTVVGAASLLALGLSGAVEPQRPDGPGRISGRT